MKPIIFITHDMYDMFEKDLDKISNNEFNWIRVDFSNLENNKYFFKYLDKVKVIISRKDLDHYYYKQAKNLELIQLPISGYDQINLKQAKKLGVKVCNTSGANAVSVAEHFFSLILANYRNIIHHHNTVINGEWINLKDFNEELFEKKLGIIGMGNIGKEIAKRAVSFGMNVVYYDIHNKRTLNFNDTKVFSCDIKKLLNDCDIVSFHVPLTNKTKKMINYELLSKMKINSIIVNLARGEIQVEDDIAKALKNNIISGAILDVFSEEPYSVSSPIINFGSETYLKSSDLISKKEFVKSSKAIFSPHSGPSKKTRQRAMTFIIENIRRLNFNLELESICIDYN